MRIHINEAIKSGQPINKSRLISLEENNIRTWLKKTSRLGFNAAKVHPIIDELKQDLSSMTDDLILDCMKRNTICDINAIRAESILKDELSKAGYTNYTIFRQRYRLKLVIPVGDRKFYIPVRFSSLPEMANKIIPSIQAIEKIAEEFGRDAKFV